MPNLCNNFLVVHGQDSELDAVAEIFKAHKERRDTGLETEPPRWEIDSIERDDIILMVSGPSAWVPPHDMLKEISSKYPVSIRLEYDEIGVCFAGHTYYEDGKDFDFCLQFYEYFFFNNLDEFQVQLETLVMTMKKDCTFEDVKQIMLRDWENTPDHASLLDMEEMFNIAKERLSK